MMSLPVWLPGSMFLPGSVSLVPCSFRRGLPDRDPLDRDPPGQRSPDTDPLYRDPLTETSMDRSHPGPRPPCMVKIGRYVSYWNEFLLTYIYIKYLK